MVCLMRSLIDDGTCKQCFIIRYPLLLQNTRKKILLLYLAVLVVEFRKMDTLDGNVCAGGDKTDARRKDGPSGSDFGEIPVLSSEIDAEDYNMNHVKRGTALIFNHASFDDNLKMPYRNGTDVDRDRLKTLLNHLGFEVEVHNNLTFWKLREIITKAANDDHSDRDCFVCVVLTHGDEGMLYSYDKKYRTHDLWMPFLGNECHSLVGKPKLFFIQACQGTAIDGGVLVQGRESVDSHQMLKIPAHADFLIAYSTVPGYYSWRNTTEGSWFIKGVCEIFSRYYSTTDVLTMLTKVNHYVAYYCISNTPRESHMHQKKQIPCISSMLTRKVYLRRK